MILHGLAKSVINSTFLANAPKPPRLCTKVNAQFSQTAPELEFWMKIVRFRCACAEKYAPTSGESFLNFFSNGGLGPEYAHSSSETSIFDPDLELLPRSQITALRT